MTNLHPLILLGLVALGAIAGTALVDFVRLTLLERFHRAEIDRLLYVPEARAVHPGEPLPADPADAPTEP